MDRREVTDRIDANVLAGIGKLGTDDGIEEDPRVLRMGAEVPPDMAGQKTRQCLGQIRRHSTD